MASGRWVSEGLLYAYLSQFFRVEQDHPAENLMKIPPTLRPVGMLMAALALTIGYYSVAVAQSSPVPGDKKIAQTDAAEAHLGRGYDALKQDRYEAAASEFRAALDLDPKLVLRARFPLAVALFELHKADESRAELEAVHRE